MPLGVSYMGTKRNVAGLVCGLVNDSRPGPFLDAFSGMCAIGTTIGSSRQLWTNDCQHFAWNVARAHFRSSELPPDQFSAAESCQAYYKNNFAELSERYGPLSLSNLRH